MTQPLIICEAVERTYGKGAAVTTALRGIDLVVDPGESVALVGPSGCGKSTLLHVIGAMDVPTGGRVLVAGRDLATLGDLAAARFRSREIGFVFQFFNLIPTSTVMDNVALPARLAGAGAGEARHKARALLDRVGLGGRATDHPDALSGGQQQRVALARALINDPQLVLADEPTGALDRTTGDEVLQLLHEVVRERGAALLMATHSRRLQESAARMIRMEDGRITADRRHAASKG